MKNFTKIMNLTLSMFVIINVIGSMKLTVAKEQCNLKLLETVTEKCRENVARSEIRNVHDLSQRATTISSNSEYSRLVKREADTEVPDLTFAGTTEPSAVNEDAAEPSAVNDDAAEPSALCFNVPGSITPYVTNAGQTIPDIKLPVHIPSVPLPIMQRSRRSVEKFDKSTGLRAAANTLDTEMSKNDVGEMYIVVLGRYVAKWNTSWEEANEKFVKLATNCCENENYCVEERIMEFC